MGLKKLKGWGKKKGCKWKFLWKVDRMNYRGSNLIRVMGYRWVMGQN